MLTEPLGAHLGIDGAHVGRAELHQPLDADGRHDELTHGVAVGGVGGGPHGLQADLEPGVRPFLDRHPRRGLGRDLAGRPLDLCTLVPQSSTRLGFGLAGDGDPPTLPGRGPASLLRAAPLALTAGWPERVALGSVCWWTDPSP